MLWFHLLFIIYGHYLCVASQGHYDQQFSVILKVQGISSSKWQHETPLTGLMNLFDTSMWYIHTLILIQSSSQMDHEYFCLFF